MNQQHIHCIVDNCHYWKEGNMCDANEILVANDKFGAEQPDYVDAAMSKQLSPTPANSSMDTCCKTFVHKNSPQNKVDGVKKI